MRISRRTFLGASTGAAANCFSAHAKGKTEAASRPVSDIDCAVFDSKSNCALRESFLGYAAALAGAHVVVGAEDLSRLRSQCRVFIVPGAVAIDGAMGDRLSDLLDEQTVLLLESGAGFLSPAEFGSHQKQLHRCFNLEVGPPVDLWSGEQAGGHVLASHRGGRSSKGEVSHERPPYIDYTWPHHAKVRDFSRVIPVSSRAGEIIGWAGELPVALKKRAGNGTLIFLGSPLGPALRAGDPEARRWLRSVIAL